MKFNFNKPLLGLDGNPVSANGETVNIGRTLANNLAAQSKGDAMKIIDWATTLWKGDTIDLDRSDQTTIRKLIEDMPTATLLIKSQWLEVLDAKPSNGMPPKGSSLVAAAAEKEQ